MSGNSDFEMVTESGWRRGLNNLIDNESARWWKTSRWWRTSLLWMAITGFMLVAVLFGKDPGSIEDGYMIYAVFAGVFPAVAVIILMQGVLVGEKKSGTAAWVLSKPVSRSAFILAKFIANSLSVLLFMVVLPGLVAFVIFSIRMNAMVNPLHFGIAVGVIFINQLFYLSLALMLGVLFNTRGPVIGIPLALLFAQQYLIGFLPFLRNFLPWNLIVPLGEQSNSVVGILLAGQPVTSWLTVLFVALESILFVAIGLWRFKKEEF
jgi:ABC-2 type transport system permease protein